MGRPGPRYGEPLFGWTHVSRPVWPGGPEGASIPASPASEGSALLTIASRVSSGSSRRRSRSRCAGTTPLPGWSQRMRADGLANGTVNSRLAMARAHLRHAADADPSLTSAWLVSRKVPTPPAPKGRRPVTVAGDLPAFLDAPERTRLGNRDRPIPIPPFDMAMRAAEPVGATLGDLVVPSGAPAPVPA